MRPSSGGSRRISKRFLPASALLAISMATPAIGTAASCFAGAGAAGACGAAVCGGRWRRSAAARRWPLWPRRHWHWRPALARRRIGGGMGGRRQRRADGRACLCRRRLSVAACRRAGQRRCGRIGRLRLDGVVGLGGRVLAACVLAACALASSVLPAAFGAAMSGSLPVGSGRNEQRPLRPRPAPAARRSRRSGTTTATTAAVGRRAATFAAASGAATAAASASAALPSAVLPSAGLLGGVAVGGLRRLRSCRRLFWPRASAGWRGRLRWRRRTCRLCSGLPSACHPCLGRRRLWPACASAFARGRRRIAVVATVGGLGLSRRRVGSGLALVVEHALKGRVRRRVARGRGGRRGRRKKGGDNGTGIGRNL